MKIRLPPELKKLIEDAVEASGRSLNAEVVHRLEQSFTDQPSGPLDADLAGRVAELERRIAELERKGQKLTAGGAQ